MSGEQLKQGLVNFKIEGKGIGLAIIISAFSSIVSIGGLIATVNSQGTKISKQEVRIESLEKNCNMVVVSLARIEEITKALTEKITDLKHSLENQRK